MLSFFAGLLVSRDGVVAHHFARGPAPADVESRRVMPPKPVDDTFRIYLVASEGERAVVAAALGTEHNVLVANDAESEKLARAHTLEISHA